MPSSAETLPSRNRLAITLDIDWACEPAIERALGWFIERGVPITVFSTHRSRALEAVMDHIEVGLHPFFGRGSSHGESVDEVVRHVMDLPHNLAAFRCHRFGVSNTSRQALLDVGMRISSNVCTDQELVPPFRDRFRMLEIPVFLEDGGYLFQGGPLHVEGKVANALAAPALKVVLVHPMHFIVNTPRFDYMVDIKKTVSREEWNGMSDATLERVRWKGHGVRDFIVELLDQAEAAGASITSFGALGQEAGVLA